MEYQELFERAEEAANVYVHYDEAIAFALLACADRLDCIATRLEQQMMQVTPLISQD